MATPRSILHGITDTSPALNQSRALAPLPPTYGLVAFTSERGPEDLIHTDLITHQLLYGKKHLERTDPYYTHGFDCVQDKTQFLSKRIVSPDATAATHRISAEVFLVQIASQIRREVIFHATPLIYPANARAFGEARIISNYRSAASLNSSYYNLPVNSILIPIMDIEIAGRGNFGNRFSIKVVEHIENAAIKYSFELFENTTSRKGATPPLDLLKDSDFFIEESFLKISEVVVDGLAYSTGIGKVKPYRSELNSLLNILTRTYTVGPYVSESNGYEPYQVGLFSGTDTSENDVELVHVGNSFLSGGTDPLRQQRFTGGSDGVPSFQTGYPNPLDHLKVLDQGVLTFLQSSELRDRLKYPFNAIQDTGYSLAVKKEFIRLGAEFKDIAITLTPYRYADYQIEIDPEPPLVISYNIVPESLTVDEGQTLSFDVTTVNFGSGTLYWTILHGTTAGVDLFGSQSGSVNIVNNQGTLTITATNDLLVESSETFRVELRVTSTGGLVVATSASVSIEDVAVQDISFIITNPVVDPIETQGITITISNIDISGNP